MKVTEQEGKHSQPNQTGLLQKNSAEHEGYAGACKTVRITENNATNANEGRLLEQILNRNNLNQAYARVKANKGARGVDKMEVGEMLKYLKINGEAIKQAIVEGKYKPNPVRRVEIPKDDGGKRPLGIPTHTHGSLETMEESQNQVYQSPKAGYRQSKSVGTRQHKKRLLAHIQQPYLAQVAYNRKVTKSGLLVLL